jgi:NitT/TauT family transport system permease protein
MNLRRIWSHAWVRRFAYFAAFALIWQVIWAIQIFPPIIFPSVGQIAESFFREMADGSLLSKTGYSLYLIGLGMAISLVLTLILTLAAMFFPTVKDLTRTLISVLDPLPGIALLPLAILWIGIGEEAILFVMVHSILWPMLLNVITGFESVPPIYEDVGRLIGLNRFKMMTGILMPASFPSILTGVKTGWARAWRALISAEMVFGATGVIGGLGWDIYIKRSYLDMPGMFASLIMIMFVGILMEDLLFRNLERVTVRRWGMMR